MTKALFRRRIKCTQLMALLVKGLESHQVELMGLLHFPGDPNAAVVVVNDKISYHTGDS